MRVQICLTIKPHTCTIFLVFCLFNGCIPNNDSSEDLSGDYFYRNEGSHVKDILSHLPNHREIYSEVLGYDYNSDFIVVAQHPIYSEYKTMIGFNLRSDLKRYPTESKEEIIESENRADSILQHDPFYRSIFEHEINYWIISTEAHRLYGPFTKEGCKKKRDDLRVPENLQIDYSK
jgi:hypothetical protein